MSVLAIDAGTTGVTALVVDPDGRIVAKGYQEFPQHFPRPGWVEHAPEEIWQATLEAVRKDLGREGYVYRFSQDPRPLADAEGAFVMCGFDMAMATHQQGWGKEALRWFERNRAACGTPGLFTEEYDVEQRQLRGNVPQAFVHAVMIEAASMLAEPPREVTP